MVLQLSQIHLKNFRCFDQFQLDIDNPILLLEGANGVGKTSILEALHYACYLRSFRKHSTKELIAFGQDDFFIKIAMQGGHSLGHTIQVGFSHNKRLVKVDQQIISSYKDLMSYYKVLSVTEDDLLVVKGGPQVRRSLIDQFLLLTDPHYGQTLRTYRQIVNQRNALLYRNVSDLDTYHILTKQLWEKSKGVQSMRQQQLALLEVQINKLSDLHLKDATRIAFSYRPKLELCDSLEQFHCENPELLMHEKRYKRSLFGIHLDDILINFCDQPSRIFASRGEQKLIVLLIKIAQLELLVSQGHPGIFLLDDFMTDFDPERAFILLKALQTLDNQLIFTSPARGGFLADQLVQMGGQVLKLPY